jgi:hypothetical protein
MASSLLEGLTAATTAADTDILYLVLDPASVPLDRKMTVADLRTLLAGAKVAKAGDTMTGALSLQGTANQLAIVGGAGVADINLTTSGGLAQIELAASGNLYLSGPAGGSMNLYVGTSGVVIADRDNSFRSLVVLSGGATAEGSHSYLATRTDFGSLSDLGAVLGVWGTATTRPTQIIRMFAAQTADAIQVQNSDGVTLFSVDRAGVVTSTFKNVLADTGPGAAASKTVTITDTKITPTSTVIVNWGNVLATDENDPECDAVTFFTRVATGSCTVRISSVDHRPTIQGRYRLAYQIG